MAVQPFQLPLDSLFASLTEPPAPAEADRGSTRHFSGMGRTVIAIAAASVFFGGAGSVYMHASMGHMSGGSMTGSMNRGSTTAEAPAMSAGTAAMPAPALPGAAPAQADAAPPRPLGDGMPMPAAAAPAAAAPVPAAPAPAPADSSPLASAPGPSPMTASSRISSSESAAGTAPRKSSSTKSATARRYTVREGDTFGTIAARSGVSEARIAALNPGVDSTSLTIGDSLRVR